MTCRCASRRASCPDYAEFLKKYPANKVFVENLGNVKHVRPNIASYSEVSTAVGQMVQSVLLGQAEPQEALDTASDQVASVLAGSVTAALAAGHRAASYQAVVAEARGPARGAGAWSPRACC